LYGGDGIQYYLDYTLLNPIASTIPKWRTFKFLRRVILLNRLADPDEIVYGDVDIEGDLDSILINPAASTISKWRSFKLLWWVELLN
jgi:hypothetical protein